MDKTAYGSSKYLSRWVLTQWVPKLHFGPIWNVFHTGCSVSVCTHAILPET